LGVGFAILLAIVVGLWWEAQEDAKEKRPRVQGETNAT
jgi:hypothetical protein